LLVAAVVLACGAGGAAAQSGPSGAPVEHLYWTNVGTGATNGTIVEANLNGTGAKTIATAQNGASGVAVGP
jgi:hypothetical protein